MNQTATVVGSEVAIAPFTVVVDQREQMPYAFAGLRTDAKEGRKPLFVPTVTAMLATGDYSITGFEDKIAIERKSKADLFGTLGNRRKAFERELRRLADMQFAAVVIETGWDEIIKDPPPRSMLPPKIIFRSVLAWMQRYPTVHWFAAFDRAFAEVAAFRMLERFYKTNNQPMPE